MFGKENEILDRLRKFFALRKYNRFTIAEYFRKQGAQIGEGCSIIPKELSSEPYLVKLGNHVTIAMGVTFITHDGGSWLFRDEIPDLQVYGPIEIKDNCVIGAHAILMPNIQIGPNSIVAAGSVVINDIPPNSIAIGVPARVLGSVEKYKEKCIARWREQKPPNCKVEDGEDWWTTKYHYENYDKLRAHLTKLFFENEKD